MKELSDEMSDSQMLAQAEQCAKTPARPEESSDTPREIFVFDGWGLVPLDIQPNG